MKPWTLDLKRNLLALFLVLSSLGAVTAQEKVLAGKVIDIDGPRLYTDRLSPSSWYQAYMGMSTFLKEKLRTDQQTQAVIEFSLGGRAGIGRNSSIQIVTLESVEKLKSGSALRIDSGTFWAKFDKQEEEIQIKTAGGVIGIEGTELLIGVDEKSTEVMLFEGKITVTDNNGRQQTMLPGDYASLGGGGGMCVLSYPAPSLRTLVVERFPKFSSFIATQNVTAIPKPASPTLIRGFNTKRADLLTVRDNSRQMTGSSPSGLQASAASGPPTFSWSGVSGADSYALYVTGDQGMDDILFSGRVNSSSFTVPQGAPGLDGGQYFWAVIPLDSKGNPIGQPAQSTFQTPGWTSSGVALED
ncbi:MAG: FecR domain-containing protein [Candidatus Eremiobacteraeota bacterium]|nr:FecR domain-containing protein [Candidatus Eremiobacteraeota bacterium]